MPVQGDPEKWSIPRILLSLGFLLILLAVGLGAALKGGSAVPKVLATAGLLFAVVGGIGSAFARKSRQGA